MPGAFRHQQAGAKEQERRTKILSSIAGVAAGRTYRLSLMMGRTRTRARISSTDTIAPFSKSADTARKAAMRRDTLAASPSEVNRRMTTLGEFAPDAARIAPGSRS